MGTKFTDEIKFEFTDFKIERLFWIIQEGLMWSPSSLNAEDKDRRISVRVIGFEEDLPGHCCLLKMEGSYEPRNKGIFWKLEKEKKKILP